MAVTKPVFTGQRHGPVMAVLFGRARAAALTSPCVATPQGWIRQSWFVEVGPRTLGRPSQTGTLTILIDGA